ncbi:ATP-binding mismatch repair protein [Dimargaris xerosporica]|nr:ATP-binding mismatch repair protein [Dimargaris xerosporica]
MVPGMPSNTPPSGQTSPSETSTASLDQARARLRQRFSLNSPSKAHVPLTLTTQDPAVIKVSQPVEEKAIPATPSPPAAIPEIMPVVTQLAGQILDQVISTATPSGAPHDADHRSTMASTTTEPSHKGDGLLDTTMRPMDSITVHKICSGQVIIDLASAVKEVVENSLDAGATMIEVKFRNYGVDGITVTDNGHGIDPSNYSTLCLKHYTSKLHTFDDLAQIQTFGFRGEALSSLCALANVTVTTTTSEQCPQGVQLEYNTTGVLTRQSSVAREAGTTVMLRQLFAHWPVRLAQFKKNAKKEYAKCITLLEAYGVVSNGARISVSHQPSNSSAAAHKVFQSSGRPQWLDRIASVFGPKFRPLLVPLDGKVDLGNEHQVMMDTGHCSSSSAITVHFSGYISRPKPGCGRSSGDRQCTYLNGRPCDLPKMARVVNEEYHAYNPSQYPILFLNLEFPSGTFDVNVSPDKRTVFLHHEAQVIQGLREALKALFEPSRSTYEVRKLTPTLIKSDSHLTNDFVKALPRAVNTDTSSAAPPVQSNLGVHCRAESLSSPLTSPLRQPTRTTGHSLEPPLQNRPLELDLAHGIEEPAAAAAKRRRLAATAVERQHDPQRPIPPSTSIASRSHQVGSKAHEVLCKTIQKTDFDQFHVVGQFNLGFIIARLHHDLFIIDQHASDEKYNFETLQATVDISSQPLIRPRVVELGVAEELTAMEHLVVLKKNGFDLSADPTRPPGKRLTLVSQPFLDHTLFDINGRCNDGGILLLLGIVAFNA